MTRLPHLGPHLRDRCAALVDGQLGAEEEERAWEHVLVCPGCRETVEQQVAAKQALGGLRPVADHPGPPTSWLHPDALAAWDRVVEVDRGHRLPARSTILGVVGGGALTASIAVAVVVGSTTASGPVVRPAPERLAAQLATPATRAAPAQPTGWATRAATATVTSWTGTATGSETSRAFRGLRSD